MTSKVMARRTALKRIALSAAGIGLASSVDISCGLVAAAPLNKMPRRELGKTGATVPILHLGTSQSMDPVYDKIMHRCFKEGVDCFDTAINYGWGSSQKAIATFTEQIGNRKDVWITTKSGAWTASGFENDVDKCLDQLKTDYIDLYMIHGISGADGVDPEYIKIGEKLKRSGKIRFFGFSIHSGDTIGAMNKAVEMGGIDAIMFRYNFRVYTDKELNLAMDACKKAGIGLIAMKTMGGVSADNEKVVRFQSQNYNLAQSKLKSVWADERIDTIVSEMQNIQEVIENVKAAKSETALTAGEFHQLNQLAAYTNHLACIGCSRICESKIDGRTNIADQLRFLSYHEVYGKTARARELYHLLSPDEKRVNPRDLAAAMKACPQRINIPERIQTAKLVLA